jgi:hypothetical protein
MKLDPGVHIGLHLFFWKNRCDTRRSPPGGQAPPPPSVVPRQRTDALGRELMTQLIRDASACAAGYQHKKAKGQLC